MRKYTSIWLLFALLIVSMPVYTQDNTSNHPWYVFVEDGIDSTGLDRLTFVDMLTGEEVTIDAYGERYTISGNTVMYFNYAQRRMMVAMPGGEVMEHPFIQLSASDYRVDWAIAADGSRIAWTYTFQDSIGHLETETWVANIDGTDERLVLSHRDETPERRAMPLAFSPDFNTLYMDLQFDGLSTFTPFNLYTHIFALDLSTGEMTFLPDEPGNCICGAAIGSGQFLRLRLTNDFTAFNLHTYDLDGAMDTVIEAIDLNTTYDTGGDILISPDGTQAVYALSRIANFGQPEQSIRTVFVRADLVTMQQQPLTPTPIRTFVIPAAWTEDNSAIIMVNPTQNGTWKINLSDGRLERIADATYIGQIRQ